MGQFARANASQRHAKPIVSVKSSGRFRYSDYTCNRSLNPYICHTQPCRKGKQAKSYVAVFSDACHINSSQYSNFTCKHLGIEFDRQVRHTLAINEQ